MPLPHYGVLVGTYDRFDRDPIDNYGNFFHGLLYLNAPPPGGQSNVSHRCAIDVKAPDGVVEYIKLGIQRDAIAGILPLANGYHPLGSNAQSGALDYVRSPFIVGPIGCASLFYGLLKLLGGSERKAFIQNAGGSVLDDFAAMLVDVRRIYVFGAFFDPLQPGNYGVHDIHMNQGDPLPATGDPDYNQKMTWYRNSGIWQDGGLLVEHNDDRVEGFFIKFLTQTMNTGDDGHPK